MRPSVLIPWNFTVLGKGNIPENMDGNAIFLPIKIRCHVPLGEHAFINYFAVINKQLSGTTQIHLKYYSYSNIN